MARCRHCGQETADSLAKCQYCGQPWEAESARLKQDRNWIAYIGAGWYIFSVFILIRERSSPESILTGPLFTTFVLVMLLLLLRLGARVMKRLVDAVLK